MFCCTMLCVLSSFVVIWGGGGRERERERAGRFTLCLSSLCIVVVVAMWLFLAVPWVGLQCVIVVFPDHMRLLFIFMYALAKAL